MNPDTPLLNDISPRSDANAHRWCGCNVPTQAARNGLRLRWEQRLRSAWQEEQKAKRIARETAEQEDTMMQEP